MTAFLMAGAPPSYVTDPLNEVMGIVAWVATAAGVMGLLIVGARMALSIRQGEGQEHLVQLGTVLGACIIAATAGPVVNFIL
ncbi:hypothetical protein [Streptomyces sp. Ru73]|uniref:hypothetical protein n=1 Tax=Streptomyces sp. Ru73 TaxID=2080748 RepID=UPI00215604E6|nr:hypothetical protein [Streptomyces sp. Ru73]